MSRYSTVSLGALLIAAVLVAPISLVFCNIARAEEEKKKSELHKKMETIDDAMKKLKRTLRKSDQNEVSLKVITDIIALATECREMTPSHAAKLSGDEQKKFVEAYRAQMSKLIETMGEMKKAVAAGDNDKAKEIRTSLKDMQEDGHDKFMESDDRAAEKGKDGEPKSEK